MDLNTVDDSDSDPIDTGIASGKFSNDERDSFDSTGWSVLGASDPDFPHHPFTVQNLGVHFPSQLESELEPLQHILRMSY